jgi:large subunit ribosomal protein L19
MNTEIINKFTKSYLKDNIPQLKSGDTVKVHQKIKEGDKERIQVFEGVIIATKHGQGVSGTFTVRKISSGVGVERIFPLHAPFIEKIEIVGRSSVRRAKLYYLRDRVGKSAKLKRTDEKAKVAPKTKK